MIDDDRQQSEFNDAIGYLNRLNSLFYLADDAAMNLDAFSWFHALLALERELSTEMNETEIKKFENTQNKINTLVSELITQNARSPNQSIPPELYNELHKFELDLRKIFKSAGLQNRMKEDASFALK
jgi:hypothetical protein